MDYLTGNLDNRCVLFQRRDPLKDLRMTQQLSLKRARLFRFVCNTCLISSAFFPLHVFVPLAIFRCATPSVQGAQSTGRLHNGSPLGHILPAGGELVLWDCR